MAGDPKKVIRILGLSGSNAIEMENLLKLYGHTKAGTSDRAKVEAQMKALAKKINKQDAVMAALKSSGMV